MRARSFGNTECNRILIYSATLSTFYSPFLGMFTVLVCLCDCLIVIFVTGHHYSLPSSFVIYTKSPRKLKKIEEVLSIAIMLIPTKNSGNERIMNKRSSYD